MYFSFSSLLLLFNYYFVSVNQVDAFVQTFRGGDVPAYHSSADIINVARLRLTVNLLVYSCYIVAVYRHCELGCRTFIACEITSESFYSYLISSSPVNLIVAYEKCTCWQHAFSVNTMAGDYIVCRCLLCRCIYDTGISYGIYVGYISGTYLYKIGDTSLNSCLFCEGEGYVIAALCGAGKFFNIRCSTEGIGNLLCAHCERQADSIPFAALECSGQTELFAWIFACSIFFRLIQCCLLNLYIVELAPSCSALILTVVLLRHI